MTVLILLCTIAGALFLALAVLEPVERAGRLGAPAAGPPGPLRWLRSKHGQLEAWMTQANLPVSVLYLAAALLAALMAAFTWLLVWQAALALTLLSGWVIRRLILFRISVRGRYVAEEIPAFLRVVTGRLRTGFSLLQALEMAVREGPPLLSAELTRVIQEVNMGASLETALERMATRLRHPDIDLVVTAMLIGKEIGGNLSETLAAMSETVAGRARLRQQVRVLTAQPRFSGVIVALLPFVILALMTAINPPFTLILFRTKIGWIVVLVGLLSQLIGILIIRRILRTGEELQT